MKINGNAVRPGMVIEHQGRLWRAVKIQHTQPGKGGAYLQVELKDIRDGTKLNERFRSSEDVERVARVGAAALAPFWRSLDPADVSEKARNDLVTAADRAAEAAIVETEPVVKGQTASSSYKPAVLENGSRIMVPPHIESGTRVVVNTADASYVERAKD
jgi:elongation factor P